MATTVPEDPIRILRLGPDDARDIVDCFHRVYGGSYANDDFHDAARLIGRMREGTLFSTGAFDRDGRLVGHMAMSRRSGATSAELGNSVVDPSARGHGLIWRIGAELVSWSMEHGDAGFIDYPTTAHHIMQRQSVKNGWETGLMLGYIPASTDGKVGPERRDLRAAATIVYHPYRGREISAESHLPEYCSEALREMAEAAGVPRSWKAARASSSLPRAEFALEHHALRGLARLTFERCGDGMQEEIARFAALEAPCRQIDFWMSDPGIGAGVRAVLDAGFWFCGWLPGFGSCDVFRMQQVDRSRTDLTPALVNPVAQSLLDRIPESG